MKKQFSMLFVFALLSSALVYLSSCEEDEGKLPNIAFKTIAGYTYTDTHITAGDSVTVGIIASKSEDKDVLKTFDISRAVNSGASSSIKNITLTTAQEDTYDADFKVGASSTAGDTVKYSFTIINRDGLINGVNLMLIAD